MSDSRSRPTSEARARELGRQPDRPRGRVLDRLLIAGAVLGVAIIVAAATGTLPGGAGVVRLIPHGDVLVHALVYGTIAAAAAACTPRWTVRLAGWTVPIAIPIVLIIALGEEALQTQDPTREPSLLDAAADAFGVTVLAPAALWWRARRDAGLTRSSTAPSADR